MQTQQIVAAILSSHIKHEQKLINPQKIKSILSKKLSTKFSNPQHILQQFDDEIHYQIEKTQSEILKERQRHDKVKIVEERQLRARSLLEQKIKSKLHKSSKKKNILDKEKLQNKVNARKLKEQLLSDRKNLIQQTQFRKRLQRFKQIKAENDPKSQSYIQDKPQINRNLLLKRSFSVRSTLEDAIQRSKEIEQIQYFKKLESLEKRKIYEKPQKIIIIPRSTDKKEWVEKLNKAAENKLIQKHGLNLMKIEQARVKKQKSMKETIEKMKQQAQFKQQQRGYRMQILKSDISKELKSRKQLLSIKNQRFLAMRNKSTPQLQNNWSDISQNKDTFGMTSKGKFIQSMVKMSKTLQNFNTSVLKADEYFEKEKERKIKKNIINEIQKIIKDEKIDILMK